MGVLYHGADYNPDQWLDRPDILAQDIDFMKKAGVNCVSLGIFAWATLEPEEGQYHLDWMEEIIEKLWAAGVSIDLATPSGARPIWLAERYPEVRRVNADRVRQLFGERHNHCYTSPVYREKVKLMNQKLAERFGRHPGVIMWHISNEYGGECHCDLCQQAFRDWLKENMARLRCSTAPGTPNSGATTIRISTPSRAPRRTAKTLCMASSWTGSASSPIRRSTS